MRVSRLWVAAGVALAVCWASSVLAQEGPAPKDKPPAKPSSAFDDDEPFVPPFRPMAKPGPGHPQGFAPGADRRGRAPGPPEEGPMRPGMPGQPGPGMPGQPGLGMPGQPGPGMPPGMSHPPGPPRWPFWDWNALQKSDPEMFTLQKEEADLERQTGELAVQYRRAEASQRGEIKQQLEKLVNQHFDVRQRRRELEIKRLEQELQRLREAVQRRNKARDEVVKKRVSELIGQEDDVAF